MRLEDSAMDSDDGRGKEKRIEDDRRRKSVGEDERIGEMKKPIGIEQFR
jgi:hypothetical protein